MRVWAQECRAYGVPEGPAEAVPHLTAPCLPEAHPSPGLAPAYSNTAPAPANLQGLVRPEAQLQPLQALEGCRRRLAFQELVALQLRLLLQRQLFRRAGGAGRGRRLALAGLGSGCGRALAVLLAVQWAGRSGAVPGPCGVLPLRAWSWLAARRWLAPCESELPTLAACHRMPDREEQMQGIQVNNYALTDLAVSALPFALTGGHGRWGCALRPVAAAGLLRGAGSSPSVQLCLYALYSGQSEGAPWQLGLAAFCPVEDPRPLLLRCAALWCRRRAAPRTGGA